MLKLRRSSWLMLLQKQSMPSQVWYLRYGLRIYMSNPQMAARHFPREVHSVSLKIIDTNEFLFDMFLEFINILRNSQLKRVRGTSPLAVAWPHCPQVATAVSLSHGLRSEGAVGLEIINLDWDGREWYLYKFLISLSIIDVCHHISFGIIAEPLKLRYLFSQPCPPGVEIHWSLCVKMSSRSIMSLLLQVFKSRTRITINQTFFFQIRHWC